MNNKKISKKQAEKVLAERDPYVEIVLEEINEKLKTLVDGQEILHGRADRLGASSGRVEGRLDKVEARLGIIEVGLKKLDVNVNLPEVIPTVIF